MRWTADDYIRGLAEFFREACEAGGWEVVVWESFVKEDTDFSAILAKVKGAEPDVFFVPAYYDKVNLIAAQAKQERITPTLLGGDGWDSSYLDLVAADGGHFLNRYSGDDPRPMVQDFVSYRTRYGVEPNVIAALAYDAANIMLQSIADTWVDDAGMVKDVMAIQESEGVTGSIGFDEFHNPIKSAAILKIESGEVGFETSFRP